MKTIGARFLIALFLMFIFIAHFIDAESDPKETTTSTSKNEPVADLKLAPPVTVKEEENKKAKEETKQRTERDEPKGAPIKKKDEILQEPEPEAKNAKNEKGSADGDAASGDPHVEECDPSNRCFDEKSNLVACLRVPGEDLLDLSLLIQNKGKGPLDVNITAPDFVSLEQSRVHLKAKENAEVKVSIKDGSNDTVIVLKAGEGSCNLTFQNAVSNAIKKNEATTLPGYFRHLSIRSAFLLIVFAAILVLGLAWSCIRFRRMKMSKYQQIDGGLPVSMDGKKENSETDGWDNSWGDDWDDVEAPMAPSKPVLTPSSKGLASRKVNKDGWKD